MEQERPESGGPWCTPTVRAGARHECDAGTGHAAFAPFRAPASVSDDV
jgi:hypothetical protein